MKKVLILDGGAAHAMAIAECLKKSGYYVAMICDNKNYWCPIKNRDFRKR